MAFNGSEGKSIDLALAKKLVKNYKEKIKDPLKECRANYFGKDLILKILSQDGCMGIRMYYGVDDSGKKQLILVGTDAKENNMIPTSEDARSASYTLADASIPCPDECGDPNDPLNAA